jgi:hypothetical protein
MRTESEANTTQPVVTVSYNVRSRARKAAGARWDTAATFGDGDERPARLIDDVSSGKLNATLLEVHDTAFRLYAPGCRGDYETHAGAQIGESAGNAALQEFIRRTGVALVLIGEAAIHRALGVSGHDRDSVTRVIKSLDAVALTTPVTILAYRPPAETVARGIVRGEVASVQLGASALSELIQAVVTPGDRRWNGGPVAGGGVVEIDSPGANAPTLHAVLHEAGSGTLLKRTYTAGSDVSVVEWAMSLLEEVRGAALLIISRGALDVGGRVPMLKLDPCDLARRGRAAVVVAT